MIGLARAWYKAKLHKYTLLTTSMGLLSEKYESDPDGMSLSELVQFEYMGKEVVAIATLSRSLNQMITQSESDTKPADDSGMYL